MMALAVFQHPCGKREALFPWETRKPCAACDLIREQARTALIYRKALK